MQAPAAPAVSSAKQVRSLNLIRTTEADFAMVSANFAKLTQAPNYTKAQPFIAILHNTSTQTAKGYAVVWDVVVNGQPHTIHAHYIQKHRMPLVATKPIKASSVRMVTPFFNLGPENFASLTPDLGVHLTSDTPMAQAQVLGAKLDAVVLNDGTYEGPDTTGLVARYRSVRQAEHDAGVAAYRLLQKGLSSADIQAALHDKAMRSSSYADPRTAAPGQMAFLFAKGQELLHLQQILAQRGIDAFTLVVTRRCAYPREQLRQA